MRHSAPNSRRRAVAALRAAGKAGGMARGTRRFSPWVESPATDTAKLELLEGFLNRSEIVDCTEYALQWLSEYAGVTHALCLARREGESTLAAIGSYGFAPGAFGTFTVSLEDWRNPLVQILGNRRHAFFPAVPPSGHERRRRPATPFEHSAFHVLPLRTGTSEEAIGLLLWDGTRRITPEIEWFAATFALRLSQLLRRIALSEGDRKQEYERSLLRAIVNAVTDPILLTDPEGRLLIANARARTLFVASEEESEGRRGAVGMNNMLLSSALSSKAIEETGAMRRELLLGNPVDGSELLFELLSTVTEDARYGTGIVSILRNVGDLRRATEQIEE